MSKKRFHRYIKCAICGEDVPVWLEEVNEKVLSVAYHNGFAWLHRNDMIRHCAAIIKAKEVIK